MCKKITAILIFVVGAIWINVVVGHYIHDIVCRDLTAVILYVLWGIIVRYNVNIYFKALVRQRRFK